MAAYARGKVRPGGSLLFMRRTGGRRTGVGLGIGPTDVAALAIHLMPNTALIGATYDIDRPAVRPWLTTPRV